MASFHGADQLRRGDTPNRMHSVMAPGGSGEPETPRQASWICASTRRNRALEAASRCPDISLIQKTFANSLARTVAPAALIVRRALRTGAVGVALRPADVR
jgi:hypothetical protein